MYSISATDQPPPSPENCSQGHRSSLIIQTAEGGSICLLCLSNLLANPRSPTVHLSYALSQLSQALSQAQFLHSLLSIHSHFLISPLVAVLSNFDDEPIAKQTIDLIQRLCDGSSSEGGGKPDVHKEFITRVSDWLSSGSLAWSCRQVHMLHCFGVLLLNQDRDAYTCIRNKDTLIFNLVTGLQLSNDEIQGEIMFVLYRLSLLSYMYMNDSVADGLLPYCTKILQISLDILMKSQSDDVRLNCVAFLMVLAQRGFFQSACSRRTGSPDSFVADNFVQITDHAMDGTSLEILFAEAVKGPLLSSDSQVQIATLDLVYMYLSSTDVPGKELQVFIEESIADYIFEILRLSGGKDAIVNSSIQVLHLLSHAEKAFGQRIAIGFSTLVPVLRHVATIPFHPVQCQLLKLVLNFVSNSPGLVSSSIGEEMSSSLAAMLKKHIDMLPETFNLSCSLVVAIMKCPSSQGNSSLSTSVKDAIVSTVSTCIRDTHPNTDQILHSLYLLKEAYAYEKEDNYTSSSHVGLRPLILDIFKCQILPWFIKTINEMEEEIVILGMIETLHSIMAQDSNSATKNFAEWLVSSSWFSVSYGCLGLFPTEKMKWMVYLTFSSLIDVLLGSDCGKLVKDAVLYLPSDPTDLLFLLGQKTSHNLELFSCQSAILLVLYVSSLYNDRIVDDKLVLASLEQFLLLNCRNFLYEVSASFTTEILVNLYGLYRGLAKVSYQVAYSPEAERILFQLLTEKDWDSISSKIHYTSLRWLFQQEKLCQSLSSQILKFCRCNNFIGDNVAFSCENNTEVDLHAFAELIKSRDNFGALIFVCLLRDLVEEARHEYEIISVLKACKNVIEIASVASDQFCENGIDVVLQNVLHYSMYSFPELFMSTCQFVFTLLKCVQSESVSNNEAWIGISIKLLDYLIPTLTSTGWTEEALTIIGCLSLILHHSASGALKEASKTIILNSSLVSAINSTISDAVSKGPALFDHDEGTRHGEILIYALLLLFFSMRSVRAILPGIVDIQTLLDVDRDMQPISYVSIRCHYLCKLLHFGCPSVKLVASFCLVELIAWVSDYTYTESVDLKFKDSDLLSMSAVFEGLIFFNDIKVAMNCSKCLASLLSWKQLKELVGSQKNSWFRVIVEELVMYLCTPSLTLKSSMNHYRPALNVAVALLNQTEVPSWMIKLFSDSSVKRIIENITPTSVNAELVIIFRKLMDSGHLSCAHIADLNCLFQACRRLIYSDDIQDSKEDHTEKIAAKQHNDVDVRSFLLSVVSAQSYSESSFLLSVVSAQSYSESPQWRHQMRKELLDEIELFMKCLMDEGDG